MGLDTSSVEQFQRLLNEKAFSQEATKALFDRFLSQGGEGARVVALEDGTGSAQSARVNADSNLGTEARFGRTSTVTGHVTADTSTQVCIAERAGRLTLTLQNLDDTTAIHVHVGTGAATVNDLRLDPGQMYSMPPGVSFEGAVSCITAAGTAELAWVEYLSGA